jgi:Ni/Co efflux regulator RcnB
MMKRILLTTAAIALSVVSAAHAQPGDDRDGHRGGGQTQAAQPQQHAQPQAPQARPGNGGGGGHWQGRQGQPGGQPQAGQPEARPQVQGQPGQQRQGRPDGGGARWNGQPGAGSANAAPAQAQQRQGDGQRRQWQGQNGQAAQSQPPQAQRQWSGGQQGRPGDNGWRDNNRGGGDNRYQGGNRDNRNWRDNNNRGGPRDYSQYRGGRSQVWHAQQRYRAPAYYWPRGYSSYAWSFGGVLPSVFYADQYVIYNYQDYGLPDPYPGTDWVRVGYDALLIERGTGYVVEAARDVFY